MLQQRGYPSGSGDTNSETSGKAHDLPSVQLPETRACTDKECQSETPQTQDLRKMEKTKNDQLLRCVYWKVLNKHLVTLQCSSYSKPQYLKCRCTFIFNALHLLFVKCGLCLELVKIACHLLILLT